MLLEESVIHASEAIANIVLFGVRSGKKNKTTQVKDFIYTCKFTIAFLQKNLGAEGFTYESIERDIVRYTRYLDINLDRLTALELERLEKFNMVSVFPKSRMELIVAARQSALDFYYGLEVE